MNILCEVQILFETVVCTDVVDATAAVIGKWKMNVFDRTEMLGE